MVLARNFQSHPHLYGCQTLSQNRWCVKHGIFGEHGRSSIASTCCWAMLRGICPGSSSVWHSFHRWKMSDCICTASWCRELQKCLTSSISLLSRQEGKYVPSKLQNNWNFFDGHHLHQLYTIYLESVLKRLCQIVFVTSLLQDQVQSTLPT